MASNGNKIIERLPKHLQGFIVDQEYDRYTPQDHAVWRYVMRQNYNYLKDVAHEAYVEGLRKTGITIERIPKIEEMNEILGKIGWAAVCVDGFIPPNAFMEFQAYKVLVIAADIRQIEHIEYTPAPDIIHEAAGHAPIIADPAYAEYLRYFGLIGAKAIPSAKDYEIYEAIRHLSIIKEDPNTPEKEILEAEEHLKELENSVTELSEMAKIRNLHWWTVEYGLIGDLKNPKIYGAGLLSSIGESVWCMSDNVKKIPYSIEAAEVTFDITKPQPQLFVTPSFNYLSEVLDQFADTMALRRGGSYGLKLAIDSKNVTTAELDSGIQISGVFTDFIEKNGEPIYIKTTGPTQLSFQDKLIIGHDKYYHSEGYGTPVGKLKYSDKHLYDYTYGDLEHFGIIEGKEVTLEYESGLIVKGILNNVRRTRAGKIILMSFSDCTVEYEGQRLFEPSWGTFDLAVGTKVSSVFAGPADPEGYEFSFPVPEEKTHKIEYTPERKRLHKLYGDVRYIRENNQDMELLPGIFEIVRKNYPNDWLLPMEILELAEKYGMHELADKVRAYLIEMKQNYPQYEDLITNGLKLIEIETRQKV